MLTLLLSINFALLGIIKLRLNLLSAFFCSLILSKTKHSCSSCMKYSKGAGRALLFLPCEHMTLKLFIPTKHCITELSTITELFQVK